MTLAWISPIGLGLALLVAGCDVLLLSPTLPGLLPGLGQPLRGQVLDSLTGQPIGHATVTGEVGLGEIGWATTDSAGRFVLYGAISRQRLSISRAGYTALTFASGPVINDQTYYLDPLFPPRFGELPIRYATIVGDVVVGGGGSQINGEITFAGLATAWGTIRDGRFALPEIREGLAGQVLSGVLAGGIVNDGPIQGSGGRPFYFQDFGEGYLGFGYAFLDVPFRTTASGAISVPWRLPSPLKIGTFGTRARVSYTNTSWASEVQTEIILDFGILGAVPVARAFASAQDIPIPSVANSKYILVGTASSANRRHESRTLIDTNTPQRTVFDLLSPPEPLYPAPGAKGLGGHPEFGWKPVNGAGSYLVEIFEGEGPSSLKPKWRGITTGTTLRYPWFGDADLNGGAILPGASYSWAVHAIRSGYGPGDGQAIALRDIPAAPGLAPGGSWLTLKLTADDLTRSSRGQPFRPFRQKTFESITRGMEFTR